MKPFCFKSDCSKALSSLGQNKRSSLYHGEKCSLSFSINMYIHTHLYTVHVYIYTYIYIYIEYIFSRCQVLVRVGLAKCFCGWIFLHKYWNFMGFPTSTSSHFHCCSVSAPVGSSNLVQNISRAYRIQPNLQLWFLCYLCTPTKGTSAKPPWSFSANIEMYHPPTWDPYDLDGFSTVSSW